MLNSSFRTCIYSRYDVDKKIRNEIYEISLKNFDKYNHRIYNVFYNDLTNAYDRYISDDDYYRIDKDNELLNKIYELAKIKYAYFNFEHGVDKIGTNNIGIWLDTLDFSIICYSSTIYALDRQTSIYCDVCETLIKYNDSICDYYILLIIEKIKNNKKYRDYDTEKYWMEALESLNEKVRKRNI